MMIFSLPASFLEPLPFREGVGVGLVSVAHRLPNPTPLRLSIKDAKTRCPSPKEEGLP